MAKFYIPVSPQGDIEIDKLVTGSNHDHYTDHVLRYLVSAAPGGIWDRIVKRLSNYLRVDEDRVDDALRNLAVSAKDRLLQCPSCGAKKNHIDSELCGTCTQAVDRVVNSANNFNPTIRAHILERLQAGLEETA